MFSIITDTSANLPTELATRLDITVIPFSYNIGGCESVCENTAAFDYSGFYGAIKKGETVSTSQIPPQRYIDIFTPLLEGGKDIVFIGMSSGISGSFVSAKIAADELAPLYAGRGIYLIDSLSASLGEGILVIKAAELRDCGVSAENTADILDSLRHRVAQLFTVNDLLYLRRGGRVSNTAAIVGTLLGIKPVLYGDTAGCIKVAGKVRGTRASLQTLSEKFAAFADIKGIKTVGIAHSDCGEDAEQLKKLILETNNNIEVLIVNYEPVTGSHVGPGALALFFEGGDDVRKRLAEKAKVALPVHKLKLPRALD